MRKDFYQVVAKLEENNTPKYVKATKDPWLPNKKPEIGHSLVFANMITSPVREIAELSEGYIVKTENSIYRIMTIDKKGLENYLAVHGFKFESHQETNNNSLYWGSKDKGCLLTYG